jgi:hypothetical protein
VIYTTNLIEPVNARLRKVTRNRGQFPAGQAALKVLYLAVRNLEEFRTPNVGIRSAGWKQALQAFTIYFEGRIPAHDNRHVHLHRRPDAPHGRRAPRRFLAPVISAFADDYIETGKAIADGLPGGRLDPPAGLFLDEVANMVPLPQLPALMSFAGETGMFVTAVFQSMAQARNRWGRDAADMLWGAATVKVIVGGLAGEELREISELAGEYRETLTTWQRGRADHSVQTTLQDRKTLTPEQIRTLSAARREALVIHATTPAVKIRMTRHYEGPHQHHYAQAVEEARRISGLTERVSARLVNRAETAAGRGDSSWRRAGLSRPASGGMGEAPDD